MSTDSSTALVPDGADLLALVELALEEARQLERDGDAADAARLYLAWARERAGEFAAVDALAGQQRRLASHGIEQRPQYRAEDDFRRRGNGGDGGKDVRRTRGSKLIDQNWSR